MKTKKRTGSPMSEACDWITPDGDSVEASAYGVVSSMVTENSMGLISFGVFMAKTTKQQQKNISSHRNLYTKESKTSIYTFYIHLKCKEYVYIFIQITYTSIHFPNQLSYIGLRGCWSL